MTWATLIPAPPGRLITHPAVPGGGPRSLREHRWLPAPHRSACALAGLVALGVLPACSDHDPFGDPLIMTAPTATRSSVTWYDEGRDELLVAQPGDDALTLERVPIGDERTLLQWTRATVGGDALLMMLVPATDKVEDVDDTLVIVSADGSGEPREIPVVAPFTAVEQSADGRLAVLYFDGSGGGSGLQNANQVAIVDLAAGTVRDLTLNGFGGQLKSVHFTNHDSAETPATIRIGSNDREILAFLADNEVVLVDVADPAADQVSVNFRDAGFSPTDPLLRVSNDLFDNPVLFLRGNVGSDVAMLTLVDQADETTGTPGFTAQVSLLPVGGPATDFETYDGESAPYLITVNPTTGSLVFTDIRTQQGFEVQLPGAADQIALRDLLTPQGPVKQVLAWATGGAAVHTLRLDDIEGALGRFTRAAGRPDGDRAARGAGQRPGARRVGAGSLCAGLRAAAGDATAVECGLRPGDVGAGRRPVAAGDAGAALGEHRGSDHARSGVDGAR